GERSGRVGGRRLRPHDALDVRERETAMPPGRANAFEETGVGPALDGREADPDRTRGVGGAEQLCQREPPTERLGVWVVLSIDKPTISSTRAGNFRCAPGVCSLMIRRLLPLALLLGCRRAPVDQPAPVVDSHAVLRDEARLVLESRCGSCHIS